MNRYGQAGIGEQANSEGPREVRLEVLAEHSTEGWRTGNNANREGGERLSPEEPL